MSRVNAQRVSVMELSIALGAAVLLHLALVVIVLAWQSPVPIAERASTASVPAVQTQPVAAAAEEELAAADAVQAAEPERADLPVKVKSAPAPHDTRNVPAVVLVEDNRLRAGSIHLTRLKPQGPVTGERRTPRLRIKKMPPPAFVAVDRMPVPIKQVIPEYPPGARLLQKEGRVIVRAWVDGTGRVRDVYLVKGISNELDSAALEAVGLWRFSPAERGGRPVDVWVSVPIRFSLGAR